MSMSTFDAAQRLGVSQRQVQRLAKSGSLSANRVVGNALVVDPLSVSARRRASVGRGRPWSAPVAWGALWLISGLEAPWLTYSQRHRLNSRIEEFDAPSLASAVRDRATVTRYRASDSAGSALARELWLTGAGTRNASQAGLAGARNSVDGYCHAATAHELVSRFALAPDLRGSVTLRVPSFADLSVGSDEMPGAVIAVDLLDSNESREREVGLRMLTELRS